MKLKILAAVVVVSNAMCVFAAPLEMSFTGTAQTTEKGYIAGNSYTFTLVWNDLYTGSSSDQFASDKNLWVEDSYNDPMLIVGFSGDGITGTFSRPSTPYNFLYATPGGLLDLGIGNNDWGGSSLGVTVNGVEVGFMQVRDMNFASFDRSATSFVNPVAWLSSYQGVHSSGGYINLNDETNNNIMFDLTTVTVGAVPEPATAGLLAGAGLLISLYRRFFSKV